MLVIRGDDARHIGRSLRMRVGDPLTVCDMRRSEYACEITGITGSEVSLRILARGESGNEPRVFVTLYQAFPKSDKMDYIVQKAVELGVGRIVPVTSERSIPRPEAERLARRLRRWQKIALEAGGQCGRGIKVEIGEALCYNEALEKLRGREGSFICYEGDGTVRLSEYFRDADLSCGASFLIGPEGGLSAGEVQAAREAGVPLVGLGKRIVRTETASGLALAALLFASGEL